MDWSLTYFALLPLNIKNGVGGGCCGLKAKYGKPPIDWYTTNEKSQCIENLRRCSIRLAISFSLINHFKQTVNRKESTSNGHVIGMTGPTANGHVATINESYTGKSSFTSFLIRKFPRIVSNLASQD